MTDIIELTQRMREAAENATRGEWIKENGDGWEAICCDDDQANGNFIIAKFLGPDKARNREFVQAVQPQNIRTLCDALAQRDAQIAALKDDFIRLDRQMSFLERAGIADRDRAQKAEAQIAELTAENVALKELISDYAKHKTAFDDFDGDRRGIAEHLYEAEQALIAGVETSATDAAANALRAEGVESFRKWLRDSADIFDQNGKHEWADKNRVAADKAKEFANQLREGK